MSAPAAEISLVIPFLNERESLPLLHARIVEVLEREGRPFEIVFVDDGSTDGSSELARGIAERDGRVSVIRFPANRGKAAALARGFKAAQGRVVFTMDADLQDDPEDIPLFLRKLDEGYDLVSGWKKKRFDPLEKRLPSKLFNAVTARATGLGLHDFNCGFKAYKRGILAEVQVYGELHRYIPPLAFWLGYRVGEVVVHHHPREYGRSKYGWERYLRGFFDLFTVVLLTKYGRNPFYLFGAAGLIVLLSGIAILAGLTATQLAFGSILGHRPLSILGVLAMLLGSQLISLGLLAELLVSIFQRKGQSQVSVRDDLVHERSDPAAGLSVVIPVHNERDSLPELHRLLREELDRVAPGAEIVVVDDGSDDGTAAALEGLFAADQRLRCVFLRRRFGKAAALQAGFDRAAGSVVVTMDGDLQDRPEEVGRLLAKLEEGFDVVLGRRVHVPSGRAFTSRLFNRAVSAASGVRVSDINCGLKAFRREVLAGLHLHGELQRLFPVLVARRGCRVAEIPVEHHERLHGASKYGAGRIPKAFFDLFSVVLLLNFRRRPLHLFGLIGILVGFAGLAINLYLTVQKALTGTIGGHYTLLLMGVMLMVLGFQWFSAGLLSELINRYFGDEDA